MIFFAMLFASVKAENRLGFHQVRDVVTEFFQFTGQVFLGSVIVMLGVQLANLFANTINVVAQIKRNFAGIAHFAIMGIVLGMRLRAMGIAVDVVKELSR